MVVDAAAPPALHSGTIVRIENYGVGGRAPVYSVSGLARCSRMTPESSIGHWSNPQIGGYTSERRGCTRVSVFAVGTADRLQSVSLEDAGIRESGAETRIRAQIAASFAVIFVASAVAQMK